MTGSQSGALARGWIEAWQRMDLDWLRANLTDDFVHTSPFGRLEGREHYLEVVVPAARKSVLELVIREVMAEDGRAAIWFENRTAEGAVDSCDWVFVEGDGIREIRSFYDTAGLRKLLPEETQQELGD